TERTAMFRQPAREGAGCAQLERIDGARDRARRRRQPLVEDVAERVRRIGGHEQHALGSRPRQPEGARARGRADAALTGKEDQQSYKRKVKREKLKERS